jgi:uncharacterized coiled-coil protein SlyX
MDRVALEKRLAEVQVAIDQTLASLNVLIGRKSELQFILSEPEREGETPPASEIGGDDDDLGGESG